MPKHLTQTQRYYICLRIASFDNIKNIVKALKVHKSTVYREIRRKDASKSKLDSCLRRNDKTDIREDKLNGGKIFKLLPHQGKRYKYNKIKVPQITNRVDISKRPTIVDKKLRIGDFEVDIIVSAKNTSKTCLLTIVDRNDTI